MKLDPKLYQKAADALRRFRWPLLIGLLGLALMLLPAGGKEQTPVPTEQPQQTQPDAEDYCAAMERRLEQILSRIEGAGNVCVMLTLEAGPSTRYQSDESRTERSDGAGRQTESEKKTVILQRGGSYNEAAVVKTEYPAFRGALIVSRGADDASVRYQLLSAVSALLGLGTDQITVVKMK